MPKHTSKNRHKQIFHQWTANYVDGAETDIAEFNRTWIPEEAVRAGKMRREIEERKEKAKLKKELKEYYYEF